MQKYNSASDFLNAVQNEIKWKRAKKAATQEIAEHISDQYDALREKGLDDEEALKKTLSELGDAKQIGERLNNLHKPKTNWLLMLITVANICVGVLVDFLFIDKGIAPLAFSIIVGLAIMVIINFLDYTILIRFPKTFYFILAFITVVVFSYDTRNGLNMIGYSYTFYLLLLFPIINVSIAFYLQKLNIEIGLLLLSIFLLPPLIIAALISSIPVLIYLIVSDSILIAYVLKNKWFSFNRMVIVGTVCMLIIAVLGLFCIDLWTDMWHNFFSFQDNFLSEYVRQTLCNASFLDSSLISTDLFAGTQEYILFRLASQYGTVVFVAVAILAGVISYITYKVVKRQTSNFGILVSTMCLSMLDIQFVLAFLGNLGFINGKYIMPFPFISSGGIYTIFNLFLIGVILSVCRFEDIAKDWIRLKQKTKKEPILK